LIGGGTFSNGMPSETGHSVPMPVAISSGDEKRDDHTWTLSSIHSLPQPVESEEHQTNKEKGK
jgi:hypothetical protein